MNTKFLPMENTLSGQSSSTKLQLQTHLPLDTSNKPIALNNVNEVKKPDKHPRNRLDEPCWIKYQRFLVVCAVVIFTSLATFIGVTAVCVTSRKHTDQTCQITFKRSAERQNGYDSRPHHVAAGDLNQDGHLDIVVANSGTDNIVVLMGYGNGTFTSKILSSTGPGSRPYSVAVEDVNNDTIPDIVVANYGLNSIGVFLGYGNGSFATQILTSLGSSRPILLAIGHFNNDSILDIAVANYGTMNIAILLGFNNGSFRIDTIYDMGYDSIPYSIALGDFNQDHKLDIAIVNYGTSELTIFLAGENGSFAIHKYSTGNSSYPSSVTVGDFNNDKTLDIAVVNSGNSSIGIFLGNGNGSFRNLMMYSTGSRSRPEFIIVSDFNNDTHLDLVVVDSINNKALVLKGIGNGNFSVVTEHSTGYNSDPCSMVVGNFDNDNKPDVAIANNGTNNVLVLTLFASYPVTSQVEYSTGTRSRPYFADVDDFNGDNYLDIVVSNFIGGTVGVFINHRDRTFQDQQTYDMGENSFPDFVVTDDINNDHYLDIIVVLSGVNSIRALLGNGNGTFRNGNLYSTGDGSNPHTIAIGDFDNNGNLDIVVSNYGTANVGIFFGFGYGTFGSMSPLLAGFGYHPTCVGIADFNNDNILDIATSSSESSDIAILLGYGNGSFQNPLFTSTNNDLLNYFTIGDLNSDNRSDIVYTDSLFSHVGVLLGTGNGTFGRLMKYLTVRGSVPWYVALGYYNDDALLDIAVNNIFDSSISVFLGTGNGLFAASDRLSTGKYSLPWSVMFSDFDNDNQQDLVVANAEDDNILIFFIHSHLDFANETSYTTGSGSHPYSVSVADLNSDGQLDIVVANSGNDDIELLLGYNNGSFMNRTIFSTGPGSQPQCVTIADFNKDHLLDIAVVNNWDNSMNVFVGFGNGSFETKSVYSTGSGSFSNSIAAGDFNKDDRMDIVIADEGTDNVAVFLAYDYVTFTNHIIYVPGLRATPYYVGTGDFNHDDRLDIAIVNFGVGNLGIYLGYGNGTFSEQLSYPTGADSEPYSLAVGDLNSDNHLDIVVANYGAHSIGLFLGYGNGSFQSQKSYSTGNSSYPRSVAMGDFNNDSRLDIVVVNSDSDNVCIFLGYGNGSFTNRLIHSMLAGSSPVWVAVGDLNNDTILDVVVANYYADNVKILLGYGNGSFENGITLSFGQDSRPRSIAIADFNKDNSLDIVVAKQMSKSIEILFGDGNGTFSSQKTYSTHSGADLSSIIVSDVNNDTILDILIVDHNREDSSFGIYYGLENEHFTLPKIYLTGLNSFPTSIAIGDFDNDSQIDLAITYSNQDSIGIMLQLKSEPFASSVLYSTDADSRPTSVAVGDFNNDDQLDIAVTNSGTKNIGIRLGFGDGSFTDQVTYSTGDDSPSSSITAGHFNNDHYLDIVVVKRGTHTISILFGCGNGTFANVTSYSTGIGSDPSSVVVGDLNKDNRSDLVVANWGTNDILVFFGVGDGTFLKRKSYNLGYDACPQSVTIGDMNNDNLLDIIVANYGSDYVEILLQTCQS